MPYLVDDIYGIINPSHLYAKKGTEVVIVCDRGAVIIVRPVNEQFGIPVLAKDLSDQPLDAPAAAEAEPPGPQLIKLPAGRRPKKAERSGSPPAQTQSSLF